MSTTDGLTFWQSLLDTIAWCSSQDLGDNGQYSLRRTLEIPSSALEGRCLPSAPGGLSGLMSLVANTRHALLPQNDKFDGFHHDKGGKILTFNPDIAFAFDGVMELESDGFFDYCDFTPHDTWVMFTPLYDLDAGTLLGEFLVSWVPDKLVPIVKEARRFNCDTYSTKWLAELPNNDLRQTMIEAHLEMFL